MDKFEFLADQMNVQYRAFDNSPKIVFYTGEYQKAIASELYKVQGADHVYKVTVEIARKGGIPIDFPKEETPYS